MKRILNDVLLKIICDAEIIARLFLVLVVYVLGQMPFKECNVISVKLSFVTF